jgi:autotransporter-associated beta strand protein
MNPLSSSYFSCKTKALALSLSLLTSAAHGEAIFDFNNGTAFDNPAGIGATMTALDTAESLNVTLTTVDILTPEYDASNVPTGSTLSALAGTGGAATNIISGQEAIGVNNLSYGNTAYQTAFGIGSESGSFNWNEAWVVEFDQAVKFSEINFSSINADEQFEVAIEGVVGTFTFAGTAAGGATGGDFADPFSGLIIPAGSDITFLATGTPSVVSVRISEFTVETIPEPTTGANLIWNGADGDSWDPNIENFTGGDVEFNIGDNVEIQTPGTINLVSAGITAGAVSVNTPTGTVTLQGGNLTTTSLQKSGASTLLIASPTTLDTGSGVATLSEGTLQIADGASLHTASLLLSNQATLLVDPLGSLNINNDLAISNGGGTLNNAALVSLNNISSDIIEIPFTKTGPGDLIITGTLGTRTTAPIDLDILTGSITATANSILNIAGPNLFDGNLILDGGMVELHGSTVTGTGSIIAQSGNATLGSRFQGGQVTISNPITLTSDLILVAPNNGGGNSQLQLDGIISGPGNIVKKGNGLVASSATNTYLGDTSIEAGTLRLGQASLDDFSTLNLGTLTNSATLDLSHSSGDTIALLFIDGEQVSPGTYGSSAVTGTTLNTTDDDHFSGDGWLIVTSGPITDDYAAWAVSGGFTLTGDMNADEDNDGLSNQHEYTFGLNPTDPSSLSPITIPLDPNTGTLTYTRRNTSLYNTGITYTYGYSTTLEPPFTPFTPESKSSDNADPVENVTITLPLELLSNPALFVRVIVE